MTKVIGDYSAAVTIDGSTNYLLIQPGNSATPYNKINRNTLLGVSGQPVDTSTSQTLTNKVLGNTNTLTIKDTLFTLQDNSDTSKQAVFELSGLTTATTRTYTLPDASTTIVGTGATQTLTNKTLTSPTITGGTYDNGTITVDSIGGHTSANVVTIAGLQINNGALNTNNSVVTANITDSAVTPAKLQTGTGAGWSWSTWSPTFTNWAIGTGGSAGTTAKFLQVGKTTFFRIATTLGSSGQSVGSGVSFTLPTTPVSMGGSGSAVMIIANAWFEHTGVSNSQGFVYTSAVTGSTTATIFVENVASTYPVTAALSSTIPFAWAAGDSMNIMGYYENA